MCVTLPGVCQAGAVRITATILTTALIPLLTACSPFVDGSPHDSYSAPAASTSTVVPTTTDAPVATLEPTQDPEIIVPAAAVRTTPPPPIVWITTTPPRPTSNVVVTKSIKPSAPPTTISVVPTTKVVVEPVTAETTAPSVPVSDIYIDDATSAKLGRTVCRRHSNGEFAHCP